MGWVTLPPFVEYPTSDKRNRNPNWTDSEITRFLNILMEKPVLHDLNAQRNKQVLNRFYPGFKQVLNWFLTGFLLCQHQDGGGGMREELGSVQSQAQEPQESVALRQGQDSGD